MTAKLLLVAPDSLQIQLSGLPQRGDRDVADQVSADWRLEFGQSGGWIAQQPGMAQANCRISRSACCSKRLSNRCFSGLQLRSGRRSRRLQAESSGCGRMA
jgi:hypothetical protein